MISKNYLLILLIFSSFLTFSQNKDRRNYTIQKITKPPKIDGLLNDETWKAVPITSNFVMVEPGDGDAAPPDHRTEIQLAYDNEAVYIAAALFEKDPGKVMKQFTQRDNINQAEFFLIDLNTYDDGENQTRFIVTAAGTQADARMTGENEDYAYNVVWESQITQDTNGWYVEIRIPYAALRFPKKEVQEWGMQMAREITHLNETYVWNYIDKSTGEFTQYNGLLSGLSNIDPPVRLSLYPYTSAYVDHFDGKTDFNFSAGMDLKYGINESFTLDMTLVPDFGQTAYDAVELNLGPFEQIFGENRAFFTEGTELFTKGNLFYSRRIGNTPIGFNDAQREKLENEEIVENPDKTDLLNALKISGRTDRGLGVGFFNAITNKTEAVYRDSLTGETRTRITEPFANYNILVLDQRFNKNSSISLINTNVTRNGNFRDANTTGFLFDVYNKANSFNFQGQATVSNIIQPGQDLTGFASELEVSRTKGHIRYGVSHEFANETYNINDLGISQINNYNNFYWESSYQIFEPQGNFNNYRISLYGKHLRRYRPDDAVFTGSGGSFFAMTRERFAFGGSLEINGKFRDYFEPRIDGRFVEYGKSGGVNAWISSDYRKKFAYDVRFYLEDYFQSKRQILDLKISPRFRFNDRFNMVYSLGYFSQINRQSFVAIEVPEIIFGNRDQNSIENSIKANYNFNSKQGLNLSFRNFWSTATFAEDQFGYLQRNGLVAANGYDPASDPNTNFNIWNLDFSYRWQFAPGSEAVLLYRNSIFNQDRLSELDYFNSLDNLFQRPARHNISLRVVYYIDYNQVRNLLNG